MIKVLNPGIYTSVQDFGRIGYQKYGVPVSGVMDRQSASFANAILGNSKTLPVLEITMQGPKLLFEDATQICIVGADMSPKLNGVEVENNKAYIVASGDILSFGKLKKGFRAYLAVLGGVKAERVMNSYSMYNGITSVFKLSKNDSLTTITKVAIKEKHHAVIKVNPDYLNDVMEVFKGPEFDRLSNEQKSLLINQKFTISKDNNRMAYQLNEPLKNHLKPIITSLVLPGTVQLTPSGKLIILMRDCQTTGGYPRVLQLKESSINLLSQKFTGATINFLLST